MINTIPKLNPCSTSNKETIKKYFLNETDKDLCEAPKDKSDCTSKLHFITNWKQFGTKKPAEMVKPYTIKFTKEERKMLLTKFKGLFGSSEPNYLKHCPEIQNIIAKGKIIRLWNNSDLPTQKNSINGNIIELKLKFIQQFINAKTFQDLKPIKNEEGKIRIKIPNLI